MLLPTSSTDRSRRNGTLPNPPQPVSYTHLVAVCDDEKSDLDGIVQSVQQYDVQGCFDIETYMDGNELLSELQMPVSYTHLDVYKRQGTASIIRHCAAFARWIR